MVNPIGWVVVQEILVAHDSRVALEAWVYISKAASQASFEKNILLSKEWAPS